MKLTTLLLFVCMLVITNSISAQTLPDSITKRIDNIFAAYSVPGSPGCTVGVVRNDSLIFAKGYGLANLEYNQPNTPATIYHMASISKQFTAYAIVLLAKQGRLQLDDDVHKYLPWFTIPGKKITIRQLLNHTSGVRDQWQMLAIAGTRLDDVITQNQVIKILSNQRALNFEPGSQYTYSNSGFTMLSEIVHSVTGKTLRQFTDSAIFKPLGMLNTHFHDDYMEVVKNRSYSYFRDGIGYKNAVLSYAVSGATSLFTNIDDMAKWVMNFYNTVVGSSNDIATLTQRGVLNNGKNIDYALGISNGQYKGWQQFSHSGGDAGYRTFISVFPGKKMGFLVFCNLGAMNAFELTNKLQAVFIQDSIQNKTTAKEDDDDKDELPKPLSDTAAVKKFVGDYISEDGTQMNIYLRNGQLFTRTNNDNDALVKESADSFSVFNTPGFAVVFKGTAAGMKAVIITPDGRINMQQFNAKQNLTGGDLQEFTGNYYCPELNCNYGIKQQDGKLLLTNSKYDDAPLTLKGKNHLYSNLWWMGHLYIRRDAAGKITGFDVNDGRVQHLAFNRVPAN